LALVVRVSLIRFMMADGATGGSAELSVARHMHA
jgi:hypothetical protein